jgi:hypothetical protein
VSKTLSEKLKKFAGFGEILFTIPHIFLPPRFQKLSHNRNMIVVLDPDQVVSVRWEGAQLEDYQPLTSKAASRLIRECLTKMSDYRRDLTILEGFVVAEAEDPFWDPRDCSPQKPCAEVATAGEMQPKQRDAGDETSTGGENPLPDECAFWQETHD